MADPRTFVLIGEFKDGITPALAEINDSIAKLKTSFASLGTRRGSGFDNVTKSVGSLVSANKHLTTSIREVKTAMSDTLGVMKEYRQELGKAARANFAIQRSASFGSSLAKEWGAAEKAAESYKKTVASAGAGPRIRRAAAGGAPPTPPTPPGGGGGGRGYTPRSFGSGGGGGSRGVARDASFAFGQTLGYGLSNVMTNAIVQGFQMGTQILMVPFQHIANNFAERIKDESTDIQTAGAMFAIDQRKGMDMFDNFNMAIRAQQKINYRLAESAAALPGATTEYVQMGKRVIDTMMTVFSKDVKGTSKFAEELGAKGGDKQDALATLTQRFTEKAVLLQQGSTYRGNYGVPQLLEQLIGKENVSENMFQKFAVYRDLPIFQSVFRDMEAEIGKTGAFSAERIRLVFQLLDEALPNEVIQAHKNSMAGFLEATKSAFLDPEVGLFGLGRKIQGMEMAMVDQYGNFLNKQGKVVKSWEEAEKEQISLYESISKILTGFGLPLAELASILPQLFEPFANLVEPLQNVFKVAQGFYRNFNIYTKEFETLAKEMFDQGLKKQAGLLKRTAGARGSLLAIANMLTAFGEMGGGEFEKISKSLQEVGTDPKKEMDKIGGIARQLLNTLFNSKFIEDLGFQIGLMVGGILQTVAQMLGFAKEGAESSKIVKGLKAGFEAAGGVTAFQSIISNFFTLVFKFLREIFMAAPAQFTLLGAGMLGLPAISSALSVALGNLIEGWIDVNLSKAAAKKAGFFDRARQAYLLDKAKARNLAVPKAQTRAGTVASPSGVLKSELIRNKQFPVALGEYKAQAMGAPRRAPSIPKPIAGAKGVPVSINSVARNAFVNTKGFLTGARAKLGAGGMAGLKNPIGMLGKFGSALTVLAGVINGVSTFLSGGDIWQSLGATAGPIVGTIIGTAIAGPLGGLIGGWIGSLEPVAQTLGDIFRNVANSLGGIVDTLANFGSALLDAIGGLTGAKSDMQALQQILVLLKIALFPLTASLQLLDMGLRAAYIAFLQIDKWVNATFQGGNRQGRIQDKIDQAQNDQLKKLYENHEYYASWSRGEGTKAKLGGKDVTWSGGRWVDAKGKEVKAGTSTSTPDPKARTKADTIGSPQLPSKSVQATAQNTAQLNQKAAQQITAAAATKTATDATRNAVVAQKASLTTIQSTISSIFALLASGGLRVQTQQQSPNIYINGQLQKNGGLGDLPFDTTQTDPNKPSSIFNWAKGGLGDAIASEMRMKPPGSDLVIANSSETVIPAAGGYGMLDFVETLRSGFNAMVTTYKEAQQKQDNTLNAIKNTLISNQQQTNARLAKLETKFTTPMMPGGLGGAGAGGVDAFTPIAQRYGLQMTSGYRPGDPGWHGANRARDFSNGTGPTPQMMQFAQYLASTYGSNLKELIYTPLGFSIKNGQRVPPYAQGSHYNHVHVAYALGLNDGRMFTSMDAAKGWEKSMVPGSVKVASITGNSGERLGETSIVNNMTVTQQPGEDGEALANRVATLFFDAVKNAQSSSIFA